MRRHALVVVFAICLSALATAAMVGCSSSDTSGGGSNSGGGMMGNGGSSSSPGGGMMGGSGSGANSYSSVGERIYLSGVGTDGQDISRSAPRVSQGALMMGGGGCASCHGADGRGGTIKMTTGTAIKAPDVTYGALIEVGFTTRPFEEPSATDWTRAASAGRGHASLADERRGPGCYDRLPQRAGRAMRTG